MDNHQKETRTAEGNSTAKYYVLNWGNIVNYYIKNAYLAGSEEFYDAKCESDFLDFINIQ